MCFVKFFWLLFLLRTWNQNFFFRFRAGKFSSATLIDESGFAFFGANVPSNGNEIASWGFDEEGSKMTTNSVSRPMLAKAAMSYESAGMAAKWLYIQVRKLDSGRFGTGFDAM